MSRAAVGRMGREALWLAAACAGCALTASLVLGLLSWSAGVMVLAFATMLAITVLAGLPIFLIFRVFGPLGLRRSVLAGAVSALAAAAAAVAYDKAFDPAPVELGVVGSIVGCLVIAGLGATVGCGFYLAYRIWAERPSSD